MALTMNYIGLQEKFGKPKKRKNKKQNNGKKPKNKNKKVLTYEELLNKPKWRKKRNQILEKYGHVCSICKSTVKLQVHHLYYEKDQNGKWKNPWNYPDEAFAVLCEDCHKKMHNKQNSQC